MTTVLFAGFLLLAGLGVLVFGVLTVRKQRKLVRTGLKADGTIVLVEADDRGDGGRAEMTAYYATVEFAGANGVVHRVRGTNCSRRKKAYQVGQVVEVLYCAGDEGSAVIHSVAGFWVVPIVLFLLGVAMVVGGCLLLKDGDDPNTRQDGKVKPVAWAVRTPDA